MEFKKLKEFYQKVKSFKFTKYFLDRKERKLSEEITTNRNLIEAYKQGIVNDKAHIIATESEIAILMRNVELLVVNIEKIQTVIKLY